MMVSLHTNEALDVRLQTDSQLGVLQRSLGPQFVSPEIIIPTSSVEEDGVYIVTEISFPFDPQQRRVNDVTEAAPMRAVDRSGTTI